MIHWQILGKAVAVVNSLGALLCPTLQKRPGRVIDFQFYILCHYHSSKIIFTCGSDSMFFPRASHIQNQPHRIFLSTGLQF